MQKRDNDALFTMSFPACKHAKRKAAFNDKLHWLAAEPFRLFFASGMLWSVMGVALWPLFYAGKLGFYPNFVHARLMIEVFGGAFVVGFLGTAGPRMATAPKLTPIELLTLFALHTACGISHLTLHMKSGDACFLALLVVLLLCLVIRVAKFRKDWSPPQMLFAVTGLLCGIAGAIMWLQPVTFLDAKRLRLASLLLYQGFLLPPVLGIGSFIFPRILGGEFGEPASASERHRSLIRAASASLLIVASFPLEAWDHIISGYALRTLIPAIYLLNEVSWRKPAGTMPNGLVLALITGFCGLASPAFFYARHIALEHLLFIGGFGLLIIIVASRVLFGHSGELNGFSKKSWFARIMIFLAMLAAMTRASADFLPSIQVSHYLYAALTWGIVGVLWMLWHRRRFIKHEEE